MRATALCLLLADDTQPLPRARGPGSGARRAGPAGTRGVLIQSQPEILLLRGRSDADPGGEDLVDLNLRVQRAVRVLQLQNLRQRTQGRRSNSSHVCRTNQASKWELGGIHWK